MGLITKLFGTYSERELKSIYPIVDKIEAMADEYRALTDEELRAKTPEFKARLANGETLDDKLLARHPLAPKRIAVVAQYLPANALRRQFPHPRSQTAVFFRQDDFHSFFVFFL